MSDSEHEDYELLHKEGITSVVPSVDCRINSKFDALKLDLDTQIAGTVDAKLENINLNLDTSIKSQFEALKLDLDARIISLLTPIKSELLCEIRTKQAAMDARLTAIENVQAYLSESVEELHMKNSEKDDNHDHKLCDGRLAAVEKFLATIHEKTSQLEQFSADNNSRCQILFDQQNAMHANIRRTAQASQSKLRH